MFIKDIKEISNKDVKIAGGKGASLGEMTKAGFPVPNGFAITTVAYDDFLKHNEILKTINDFLKNR